VLAWVVDDPLAAPSERRHMPAGRGVDACLNTGVERELRRA